MWLRSRDSLRRQGRGFRRLRPGLRLLGLLSQLLDEGRLLLLLLLCRL